ncbi:acylphosphatase [Bifidobacterium platyrrhinorum]|uniref:acylphosphatase n=1 Tax=Bifidobacterium platyrrhinorum TaxID=2661628 RepID=A0A6L9SUU0_9BIFI|nr:acylphosphatase [Bifidobacterium platyrrhinorum]NEG54941.1 acylphosphatase [Bifidobacterium platyrrhinorum]
MGAAAGAHDARDARDARALLRVHVRVSGLVQGVGYRYFAYQEARHAGVTGWVRNLWDGDVEAEAQGTRGDVAAFVSRLKVGPRWGHVDAVAVDEIDVDPGEGEFRVTR